MKQLLILLLVTSTAMMGCVSKTGGVKHISVTTTHEGVDDEYSRGFFNCLSIMEHRNMYDHMETLPYWEECKKSGIDQVDLYNDWDSAYLINFNRK